MPRTCKITGLGKENILARSLKAREDISQYDQHLHFNSLKIQSSRKHSSLPVIIKHPDSVT